MEKIEWLISISGVLQIDKAINQKAMVMTQMEDRLFLNPLAKIKNVPRKETPPEKSEAEKEFSDL